MQKKNILEIIIFCEEVDDEGKKNIIKRKCESFGFIVENDPVNRGKEFWILADEGEEKKIPEIDGFAKNSACPNFHLVPSSVFIDSKTKEECVQTLLEFSKLLEGTVISCTGYSSSEKLLLEYLTASMGGRFLRDFTMDVTHLCAAHTASEKYLMALELNIIIINESWISEIFWKKKHVNPNKERFKIPPFLGCKICITGFVGEERIEVINIITENGGEYLSDLDEDQCTHLVAETSSSMKYDYAKTWEIPIVSSKWLYECARKKVYLPLQDFSFIDDKNNNDLRRELSYKSAEESLSIKMQYDETNNDFLDGCRFLLVGLKPDKFLMAQQMIQHGGGTLFHSFRPTLTHIVGPDEDGAYEIVQTHFKKSEKYSSYSLFKLSSLIVYPVVNSVYDYANVNQNNVLESKSGGFRNNLASCLVSLKWLIECYREKSLKPTKHYELKPKTFSKNVVGGNVGLIRKVRDNKGNLLHRSRTSSLVLKVAKQSDSTNVTKCSNVGVNFRDFYKEMKIPHSDQNGSVKKLLLSTAPLKLNFGKSISNREINSKMKVKQIFNNSVFCFFHLDMSEKMGSKRKIKERGGQIQQLTEINKEKRYKYKFCLCKYFPFKEEIRNIKTSEFTFVNQTWLEECIKGSTLWNPEKSVEFIPYPFCKSKSDKLNCLNGKVISVSMFVSNERDVLKDWIEFAGGRYTEEFRRSSNTHLISKAENGPKFKKAIEWKKPVVSWKWVYDCIVSKKIEDPLEYPVSADKIDFTKMTEEEIPLTAKTDPLTNIPSSLGGDDQVPIININKCNTDSSLNDSGQNDKIFHPSSKNNDNIKNNNMDVDIEDKFNANDNANADVDVVNINLLNGMQVNDPPVLFEDDNVNVNKEESKFEDFSKIFLYIHRSIKKNYGSVLVEKLSKYLKNKGVKVQKSMNLKVTHFIYEGLFEESTKEIELAKSRLNDLFVLTFDWMKQCESLGIRAKEDDFIVNNNCNTIININNNNDGSNSEMKSNIKEINNEPNAPKQVIPSLKRYRNISSSSSNPFKKQRKVRRWQLEQEDEDMFSAKSNRTGNGFNSESNEGADEESEESENEVKYGIAPSQANRKRKLMMKLNGSINLKDEPLDKLEKIEEIEEKKKYVFVLSGFDKARREKYSRIIINLGGEIEMENINYSNVTHIVAGCLKKCEKVLVGISSRKWILVPQFLDKSSENGKFVKEGEFLWQNKPSFDGNTRVLQKATEFWRQQISSPFFKLNVFLDIEPFKVKLFSSIIRAGGGSTSTRVENGGGIMKFSFGLFDAFDGNLQRMKNISFLKDEGIPCYKSEFLTEKICCCEMNPDVSDFELH